MQKVFFTIDSSADIPAQLLERYDDVRITPLHILLGDKSYLDGVDITASQLIEFVAKSNTLPKTAAVTPGEYEEVFSELTGAGFSVVHIALSSGVSSSCSNARIAAESFENVYVVDSLLLTSTMAFLLVKGCEMRERGLEASDIAKELESIKGKIKTTFILDNLRYLHKGGRCSGVAAFGANVLGIKPCIEMHDGVLSVGRKYRGSYSNCQLSYAGDVLDAHPDIDTSLCILDYTPGMSSEQEKALKKEIMRHVKFDEILVANPGCTITSHCGPDTMAVLFMTK